MVLAPPPRPQLRYRARQPTKGYSYRETQQAITDAISREKQRQGSPLTSYDAPEIEPNSFSEESYEYDDYDNEVIGDYQDAVEPLKGYGIPQAEPIGIGGAEAPVQNYGIPQADPIQSAPPVQKLWHPTS